MTNSRSINHRDHSHQQQQQPRNKCAMSRKESSHTGHRWSDGNRDAFNECTKGKLYRSSLACCLSKVTCTISFENRIALAETVCRSSSTISKDSSIKYHCLPPRRDSKLVLICIGHDKKAKEEETLMSFYSCCPCSHWKESFLQSSLGYSNDETFTFGNPA